MKTKKEILQTLLDEATESVIKNELKEGFASLRHSETQEHKYVEILADCKREKKEYDMWIAYLTEQLNLA